MLQPSLQQLRQLVLLLVVSAFLFVSCTSTSSEEEESRTFISYDYLYRPPASQADGWQVKAIGQEQLAEEMVSSVLGNTSLGVQAVLLSQGGSLVLEEFKKGFGPDSLLPLQDNQLLLISTLAAVWEDSSTSLQQKMVSLPSVVHANKSSLADTSVSLHHLLKMEADMLCRPQNQVFQEVAGQSHPSSFYYCPANYRAVAQWLEDEVDGSLSFFAEERLFEPLVIDSYSWDEEEVYLPARDMLKLASVYAQNGKWQGQSLFADQWVLQLVEKAYDAKAQGQFAWGWWQHRLLANGRQYTIFYSRGTNYLLVYIPDVSAGMLLAGDLKISVADYFPYIQQAIPALAKRQ